MRKKKRKIGSKVHAYLDGGRNKRARKKARRNPADYTYAFFPAGKKFNQYAYTSRDGQHWGIMFKAGRKQLVRLFRKYKIKSMRRVAELDGRPVKGRLYKFIIIKTKNTE